MRVTDIYSPKVFTIRPDATLKDAVRQMVDDHTNTLLVTDEVGHYLGLITSKDLILAVLPDFLEDKQIAALAKEGTFEQVVKEAADLNVQEFMATNITPVKLDTLVIRVAANVLYQNESRLPVVDDEGKVIGIVTRTQIKNAVARVLDIEAK